MKSSHVVLIVGGVAVVGVGAWLIFRAKPQGVAQAGAVANTGYVGQGQYYPYAVPQAQRLDNTQAANQPWSAAIPRPGGTQLTGLESLTRDISSGINLVSTLGQGYETASDLWSGLTNLFD